MPSSLPPSPPSTPISNAEEKERHTTFDALGSAARDLVKVFQTRRRRRFERRAHASNDIASDIFKTGVVYSALVSALDYLRRYDSPTWLHLEHRERWEYHADTQTIRFRMSPSPFHENIRHSVETNLVNLVRSALDQSTLLDPEDRKQALQLWDKDVQQIGSADVRHSTLLPGELLSRQGKDSPDSSWTFRNATTPSCVLEVAWTEDLRDLKKKCERYVLDIETNVRTAIGIKCDYSTSDTASLPATYVLVYRRYFEPDSKEYGLETWGPRDLFGPKDCSISIRLADFVPWTTTLAETHIQRWSDAVGDVVLPEELLKEIVGTANLLRQDKSQGPVPDRNPLAEATLGKRRRADSEEHSEAEEQQNDNATASVNESFSSTENTSASDPSYVPVSSAALPSTQPVVDSHRRQSKRVKNASDLHGP
ncbi:hypothetical protein CLAFUW4_14813 [Fulvia fulva]|nr:hypothetical protein CLAFUR0_14805 [Fulvia fulva]WPV23015.1 hypothetical protein CLAFUW4_14813 [Fulvia fulva]WPV37964.1 hypothetical protein CLAFUW7_14814 [Fulvia fulva]